jgi:hypothetical protein
VIFSIILLLAALPQHVNAAHIFSAHYNSFKNTRVCLLARRMEQGPTPELLNARERWLSVENFIGNHVSPNIQDHCSQSEMNLAQDAALAIFRGGEKFLIGLPVRTLERDYLLPLCRVFSTFQALLSRRIGQDRIQGGHGSVKLPLEASRTVRYVTDVLFQALIKRNLVVSSDSYGYLCREYREDRLVRYWFHTNHPSDPFYEIFLVTGHYTGLIHFTSFEVRNRQLFSKSILFHMGQIQEAQGVLAYHVLRGKNLGKPSEQLDVSHITSYITYSGSLGWPEKKLSPFHNLPPHCFYEGSTYPTLESAVQRFWSIQPGLKNVPIFFMTRVPQAQQRLNALCFLNHCCWSLEGEDQNNPTLFQMTVDTNVEEGATNFLDWIREKLFRKKSIDDDFGNFLEMLLGQLEQPMVASGPGSYGEHFEKARGCFAYPIKAGKEKTKLDAKANTFWQEKECEFRMRSQWTYYVILNYLGEMGEKAFQGLAEEFGETIPLNDQKVGDIESSARCVQSFVTYLMEIVMPQELFSGNIMTLLSKNSQGL